VIIVYVGLERSYAAEVDVDAGRAGVSGGADSGVSTAAQTSRPRARSRGTCVTVHTDLVHAAGVEQTSSRSSSVCVCVSS